ncbi:MAG TPA: hypothetical protein ENI33_02695 [Thermoplasmatales archaeon]|nr:hypothetical protein [Thermoplasmatales archaeon]
MRSANWRKAFVGVSVIFILQIASMTIPISILKEKCEIGKQSLAGNILYVGGIGPNNYTHIQDAIDDAENGDTVFVYHGTYRENIAMDKSITLIGENKNITFIDGNGLGDVVYISADNVVVSEFTIQNSGKKEGDAGIDVVSNQVTISRNMIANNGRNGISFNGSSDSTIFHNIISNNRYAGIFLCNSSNNTIANNFIANQTRSPYYSRGIYLKLSDNNIILNNTFTNNAGYDIFLIESPYTTVIGGYTYVKIPPYIVLHCNHLAIY